RGPHHDQSAVRGTRQRRNAAFDLIGAAHPDRGHLQAERWSHSLDRGKPSGAGRHGRIADDGDPTYARRDLLEKLEPLPAHAEFRRGETRGVPARPRETLHPAAADRIDGRDEHDWHSAAHLLQRANDRARGGNDDIRRECDQFRRVFAEAIQIARTPAVFDAHIAADRPTAFLQPLRERRGHGYYIRIVRALAHEHANATHALALLRARRERPRNGSAAHQRDEVAALHFDYLVGNCPHRISGQPSGGRTTQN